ncbi:hypothetical protein [Emticicia fontis]
MEKEHNEEKMVTTEPVKAEWNKPEIEILPVKEKTLGGPAGVIDGITFS